MNEENKAKNYLPVPKSLTREMNPAQREAIETLEGPVMVVAGPGSGKTRVLTHRIAALVSTQRAFPWEILAVTFTNKAANEMRERITALVGSKANDMWVSTFHSACVKILRMNAPEARLPKSFSIVDASDGLKIIKDILKGLGMPQDASDAKEAASVISRAKNAAQTPEEVAEGPNGWVAPVMEAYERRLEDMGAVDFDSILLKTLSLLKNNQEVLSRYQKKFKYVLVDEYQDTNRVQYEITQLLSAKLRNLCVVGDLDQSVYSWRGASPEAMGGFPSDYPDAKVVILEQNYRSTKAIVDTYRAIIEPNPAIHRPKLFTENEQGEPVKVIVAPTDQEEAAFVVKEIKDKPSYESTAVLMRTNSQTRALEEELTKNAIPYSVVGALRFYDRAEIKDALSYLRFALNPLDRVSFARCVNTPRRGIGDATVNLVIEYAENNKVSLVDAIEMGLENEHFKGKAASNLRSFLDCYLKVLDASLLGPSAALKSVAEDAGLKAALEADKKEGPDRVANFEELINGASDFEESESTTSPESEKIKDLSGIEQTMAYVENVALVSAVDNEDTASTQKAVLLTAHASKGKEFDHVWVVGVEDSLFPHSRSTDPESIEEERRLLFVACSRPRKTLTLLRAISRRAFGQIQQNLASPFLKDLPQDVKTVRIGSKPSTGSYLGSSSYSSVRPRTMPQSQTTSRPLGQRQSFAPKKPLMQNGPRLNPADVETGTKVTHAVFGEGNVEKVEGNSAHINFSGSLRIMDLTMAPLRKL